MNQEGDRAIKLIEVNTSGKYAISEEGKAFLSKINGPIAVISVAGMYRTGKSYLLNRMLLNRSNGFGVGPTVNPCTKGLWCWSKPIVGKTPEGQSINVIIIDTEGIGALDQDQTHDTRIFTLAILSASAFIYNSAGSIDENALQNLSLVVNLTKNIQLNTTQAEEQQDDPEELADYFPAFYWVVRDFSLQLINSQGDQITPKQYLERALAPQKGFSDDVEEKNRIRRLLSSFFKQRECFTLVRPLVDEKKLQHLDQLDLDQLRPQFVDQVMNFRRRILGRVRPKLFKGKQLDGGMYLCLLSSYVNAINNGAVPNIENAWNYMCQQKCAQAFEQSLNYFNESVQKTIKCVFPTEQEYLMEQLKQVKEKACDLFETNSVGEKTRFHLKELRENLQHKIYLLKTQNEQHAQAVLKSYFKKSIVEIQNKLRLRQYGSFDEFMKELNQFYSSLLENGPVLPKKDVVFLALLRKVIPTAAQIFLKEKLEQLKTLKATADQKQMNLQLTIQQLKKQVKESEDTNRERITKLDREKVQLQLELQEIRRQHEELKQKTTAQYEKWQTEMKQIGESSRKKESALNEKITSLNSQISKLQNEILSLNNEFKKETALIEYKNKQLSTEYEELKKKEATSLISLKNLQISSSNTLKVIKEEYQQKIKEKELQLRKLRLTSTDLQEHNKSLEQELAHLKSENQIQIAQLRVTLQKKQSELIRLNRQKENQENQFKKLSQQEVDKLNSQLAKYTQQKDDLQKQLRTQHTNFSNKERNLLQQLQLAKQKIQFAEIQSQQSKNQLIKTKKDYEEKISALIEENTLKQTNNSKIQELTQTYESRINQLKNENQNLSKKSAAEIDMLNKKLAEALSEVKSSRTKFQAEEQEQERLIKELQERLQTQQKDLEERMAELQSEWKIKQKNLLEKIDRLENELQESKDKMEREQREDHEKSQQIVLQLKNYYEIEKEKLENKIISQKEKYDRKLAELKAQYQEKLREEMAELQSQCQYLNSKYAETEEQLIKQRTNRKIEVDIKNKTIENLERTNEQMKSKIDNKEVELLNKIDRIQKEQSAQKETLYAKIQELLTKQSKFEKQKSQLTHSKEQLEKILQMKEKNLEQLKEELTHLKEKNQTDKENQKTLRNQLNTRLMEDRVQFEKKMALLAQENQYLKIKIQENEKYIESHHLTQEDRVKKIKEESLEELKALKEKSQNEIEALESKYEKLKKSAKEKQVTMQKTLNQLEKELAISNEKLINLSEKLRAEEEKKLNQSQLYSSNLSNLKTNLNKEKEQLKEQLENEIKEREKLESEILALTASHQQEKMLLENKNKFLEDGKERNKLEYEETKNKLESIIENNRKKWAQEKTNLELAHSEHLAKVEKKHWQEKEEVAENFKKLELEYENKLRAIQSQNRVLNEKLAIEEQNKMGTQNLSDRRLKQMFNNEKKLQSELDRLKATRENQLAEIQNHQKEKQILKQKLNQKEEKYKTLEKNKQHLFYQFEKERAKWKIEKESLIAKAEEQKQNATKIQKQYQKLNREFDKLRVERKYQKSAMQSVGRFSSNFSIDKGLSRSSLEESVLKENSNNTSQISDNSLFFKE